MPPMEKLPALNALLFYLGLRRRHGRVIRSWLHKSEPSVAGMNAQFLMRWRRHPFAVTEVED